MEKPVTFTIKRPLKLTITFIIVSAVLTVFFTILGIALERALSNHAILDIYSGYPSVPTAIATLVVDDAATLTRYATEIGLVLLAIQLVRRFIVSQSASMTRS